MLVCEKDKTKFATPELCSKCPHKCCCKTGKMVLSKSRKRRRPSFE